MLGELEAAAADWLRGLVKDRHPHAPPIGQPCANCSTPLQGQYCYVCGQNSDDHKRSILHLLLEAIEGLFHFDGRLWRTMPLLFFGPGRLARDYIEGRTARHVPPLRTFLVALLLFIFAAEHAIHSFRADAEVKAQAEARKLATPQGRASESARLRAEAVKERDNDLKEAASDRAGDLRDADSPAERARVEAAYQRETKRAADSYARDMAKAERVARGQEIPHSQVFGASEPARKEMADKVRADSDLKVQVAGKPTSNARGRDWFKQGLAKAIENPDYYLTVMFNWAHRLAVLLLPIVGLSLALVYINKRQFFLYDHLLVAMNLLSFAFLTNALGLVLPLALWPFWFGLLAIWTPVNLFQTLRGAYGSSILGAVLKTLVVWFITAFAFTTLMVALLVFTLSQV